MRLLALLVAFASLASAALAELPSADELKAALAAPILEEGTPQNEVKAFCEARVLKMPGDDAPQWKSAEAWNKYADEIRQNVLERVVFRGEAAKWRDFQGKVEWRETIEAGEGYQIKKLRFEAVPGLWVPALLYEPTKLEGKMPVFLNVNGHDGAGKAAPYKQIRCINMAKRGIIALNLEWFGMGQLKGPGFTHYKLNQLDLCGTSGVAPFFLAMKRGLDILLEHKHADPTRVGVAGLSGGGWQTIFFSSLDTRVTLANPVAGYSSFITRIHNYSDLGDSEQTPVDLAATGDYAHLTAMLAPRVALLTYNEKDNCCFAAPHALPPLRLVARSSFQAAGKPENLHDHVNYDPGTHNFERDNREALYRVIGQHWYPDDASFSAKEIESESEVKKPEELAVELPSDNLDLNSLAMRVMKELPRGKADRATLRATLRLRDKPGKLAAEQTSKSELGETKVAAWKLKLDDSWTIPAVHFSAGGDQGTAIVLADAGRGSQAERVRELLESGWQVLAVDPFYFGESKIQSHDFLFALLVSSVGERPLGVQARQLHAIARWLKDEQKAKQVQIVADGPRTSLIALAAAASAEKCADRLTLRGSLGSLQEVIEQGGQVDKTPEAFCFGLLQTADIAQLIQLASPCDVRVVDPPERLKEAIEALQ